MGPAARSILGAIVGREAAMTVGPGYGPADMTRAQMRASTADRDRAVELVTRAYTEGRPGRASRAATKEE